MDIRPACWADFDDARGAHAFGDEICFKSDLDAAAAQRGLAGQLRDVEEFAACGHLGGAGGAAFGVLQGVLGTIHQRRDARFEVGIERGVHAAKQGR
ncbi:MAG: hypothetical protein ACK56I_13195, partial [bacterium]